MGSDGDLAKLKNFPKQEIFVTYYAEARTVITRPLTPRLAQRPTAIA